MSTLLDALKKAQQYTPPPAADAGEYEVSIRRIEEKKDKNNDDYFLVVLHNDDEPDKSDIMVNLNLPAGNEWDDMRSQILQNFCNCFSIDDMTVLATEDRSSIYGSTGKVLLDLEDDQNGIPRNRVKKWL